MSGKIPEKDKENQGMTRLIMAGIGIGFLLGLGLFGLRSLLSPQKPALPSPIPGATPVMIPLPPSAAAVNEPLAIATPTPILFQFDQMWAAVGDSAPAFSLKTLDGKTVGLDAFSGRPVIINYWATWCQYCDEEMTALQTVYRKYQPDGLAVVGINVIEKDNLEKVVEKTAELHLTYPILLDTETSTTAAKYGVNGLPASYFIDAVGILRRIRVGAMTQAEIEKYALEIMPE